jgi:hypothetical protein
MKTQIFLLFFFFLFLVLVSELVNEGIAFGIFGGAFAVWSASVFCSR